jgi:hypothetical protein
MALIAMVTELWSCRTRWHFKVNVGALFAFAKVDWYCLLSGKNARIVDPQLPLHHGVGTHALADNVPTGFPPSNFKVSAFISSHGEILMRRRNSENCYLSV